MSLTSIDLFANILDCLKICQLIIDKTNALLSVDNIKIILISENSMLIYDPEAKCFKVMSGL